MLSETIEESSLQWPRLEYRDPIVEWQVRGHQRIAWRMTLPENVEVQFGPCCRLDHEAELIEVQKLQTCQSLLELYES